MKIKTISAFVAAVAAAALFSSCGGGNQPAVESAPYESPAPEFSADSAYRYVAEQCEFGPRTMNSEAHDKCGDYIAAKFESFGATVKSQYADLMLYDGTPVKARNIMASYNPDKQKRILICAHWDSRPWADHDRNQENHRKPIDGANDGASGVGVMLEMARLIQLKSPNVGVDFVCFDAEDSGLPEWEGESAESDTTWCLGSRYWAKQAKASGYTARYGILLDMVGGNNTVFYKEGFSMHWAPTVVDKVWAAAYRIGMNDYFVNDTGGYITDDHGPVSQIARIPCIDLIGSDRISHGFCATWHTMNDNIKNINKNVLKAAGQTVAEVIYCEQ
jgi:hypothetical protein